MATKSEPIDELFRSYQEGFERGAHHARRAATAKKEERLRGAEKRRTTVVSDAQRRHDERIRLARERDAKADARREAARREREARAAQRDANVEARRVTQTETSQRRRTARIQTAAISAPSQLRAPNIGPGPGAPSGLGITRQLAVRTVVLFTGVSVVAVIVRDAGKNPGGVALPVNVNGATSTVKVPTHLHNLAGVMLGGLLSLVVAEFAPALGLAMGGVLAFDSVTSTGLIPKLSTAVSPRTAPVPIPNTNAPGQSGTQAGTGVGFGYGYDPTVVAQNVPAAHTGTARTTYK